MTQITNSPKRILTETKSVLSQYSSSADKHVLSNITSQPIHPIMRVLSLLPSNGIHPPVDIYSILDFDPMNVLSLGISKFLQECLVALLGHSKRITIVMKTKQGSCISFK